MTRPGLAMAIAIGALVSTLRVGVPLAQAPADEWLAKPVDDRTFSTYLDFFAYDRQVPFETRVEATEEREGLQVERLSFQSTPGVRVPAVLYQPAGGASERRPAVILLHGGAPTGKDGASQVVTASALSRAGWKALSIDMQHFGDRAKGLFTTFSDPEKHERLYNQPSAYLAWVTQTVKDVRRAFDFLVDERGADPDRIALFGFSRGGIAGSVAAGVEPRLAAVVLYYAGHFDALETGHLPAACPANYIGRISPRPLLMFNGTRDSDMIQDRSVEPLFRLARQPKDIIWTDGGHGFTTEEQRAAIIQWLRDKLH